MHLLLTGAWNEAEAHIPQLQKLGHEIVFLQQEADPLPCDPAWVEGTICNGLFLHHSIEVFPNLRFIQLTSVGFDRVPLDYVREKGIEIHNARGVYSVPMAEFAIAGVLSIYKDLPRFQLQQDAHVWQKNRELRELAGKRVVIVGCGSVGTECAKRFKAFGCQVIGIDVTARDDSWFDRMVEIGELDRVLPGADVVVLTVPLTEKTRGLIDERRLNLIGNQGILVNIARGGIIDQKALETWNGSAVLDVFEKEPLEDSSPLWEKENTIVTPHNSFVGSGNGERLTNVIFKNLKGCI